MEAEFGVVNLKCKFVCIYGLCFLATVRLPLWQLEKGFDLGGGGGMIFWLVDGVVLDT